MEILNRLTRSSLVGRSPTWKITGPQTTFQRKIKKNGLGLFWVGRPRRRLRRRSNSIHPPTPGGNLWWGLSTRGLPPAGGWSRSEARIISVGGRFHRFRKVNWLLRAGWAPRMGWSRVGRRRRWSHPGRPRHFQNYYLTQLVQLARKVKESSTELFPRFSSSSSKGNLFNVNLFRRVRKIQPLLSVESSLPTRPFFPVLWEETPWSSAPSTQKLVSRSFLKELPFFKVVPLQQKLLRQRRFIRAEFYRTNLLIRFAKGFPKGVLRHGVGKLVFRPRAFRENRCRRNRVVPRMIGWRPNPRWMSRRRRRRRLPQQVWLRVLRTRRGRSFLRVLPPPGWGGFFSPRPARYGLNKNRRGRRRRRRIGFRSSLLQSRQKRLVEREKYKVIRLLRPFHLRRRRQPTNKKSFWRFRFSHRRRRYRRHRLRVKGIRSQIYWGWSASAHPVGSLHRLLGGFTTRGIPRGEYFFRQQSRRVGNKWGRHLEQLLHVGVGHYPRSRAGKVQRVPSLFSARGARSLARNWLRQGMRLRGERTWWERAHQELLSPARALKARADHLKIFTAGIALL